MHGYGAGNEGLDRGINLIDTAPVYGFGRYLAPDIVNVKLTDTTAYLTTRQATTPAFTGSLVLTLRHVPFDQWQRYGSV
jgi:hypothetical protein